jgi:proline iminopeptidase
MLKYLLATVLAMPLVTFASAAMPPDGLAPGEHTALLDGNIRIHYAVQGHGPLLVVQAPAWGIGSSYLRNGLAPLGKHFTVLTYDPRGSDQSSHVQPDAKLTNLQMTDDLEQLRQYWGVSQLDLLGHSNGGAIAILYAERYPQHVRKLIVVGAQLLGYSGKLGPVGHAENLRRKADPDFVYYRAHINDPSPDTDTAFTAYFRARAGFFVYDPKKDAATFLSQLTNTMTASVNHAFIESPAPADTPPLSDLGKITAQTLVVEGKQDPVCPLDEAQAIQAGITHAQLQAIDHAGHFSWVEQPAEFFGPVQQFLQQP